MKVNQYMVNLSIVIPYYTSDEQFWTPFLIERQARIQVISEDLKDTISDPKKALSIKIPVHIIGTNEFKDKFGMGCALHNMDASRRKGKWQDQLQ